MALTPEEKIMKGGLVATLRDWIKGKIEDAKSVPLTCSLPVGGWVNNSITVTCTGVTSGCNVIVTPSPESHDEYCDCGIKCTAQAADSLTFTRKEANSSVLMVNVLCSK